MFDPVAVLDRAPRHVRRFAYRVAAGQGVLGSIADVVRYRYSHADIPTLPPVGGAPRRLFIGPTNSAGQGYRWARAAAAHLEGVDAVAMYGTGVDPFRPDVDLRVPVAVYQRSRVWHDRLEQFLEQQTHLVWESGMPLLGRRYDSNLKREVELFTARGQRAALFFHGSDIRPPALHAAQSPWSPFHEESGPVDTLEDETARNAELAASLGIPVFVSTPDLLRWQPDAVWCPVVVDPEPWREAASVRRATDRPVVVHAPSQKWLKGTDLVEPLLRRLSAEGVIDYRQIVGVPHAAMPEFYAEADIVLDQFVLGIYGVATCEALAAGRLVMSHVDGFTRALVRERTGLDLPVHETTIDTLEAELRRAAADPEAFDALRAQGPGFVEAIHDGRRSAAALAPFLGT